jgi:hypothetical protein
VTHQRLMAMAERVPRRGDTEPLFYAAGAELDWLETLAHLGPIDRERLAFLRADRACGAIAEQGERWPVR